MGNNGRVVCNAPNDQLNVASHVTDMVIAFLLGLIVETLITWYILTGLTKTVLPCGKAMGK